MIKNYCKIFASLLASGLLFSCSSTNSLTMSVTEPAPIHLESKGKSVGILNRSLPAKQNEVFDAIDKILSAEGKDFDKDGANESVLGLQNELTKNNGFNAVKLIDESDLKSVGLSVFPAPLSWETVEKVSRQNQVDYLFELSFYDTDTKVAYKTATVEKANVLGIKIPVIEHQATVSTLIKNGWRIYDVRNRNIVDEQANNNVTTSVGKGINPVTAVEAVLGRKQNVLQLSNHLGSDYALKTLPYKIRVSRDYYVKGTSNFEIGKRRAQTGNWDGAAELWEKEINNSDPEIAGRACYNMAIINEINGNLEAAVNWASKSYSDYGDKLALRYLNVLKNRQYKKQQLESQLQ
ncbi:DUF6340 family protein [Flavobacterium enshiense]|uniref:DUF6340 family protein n=1 Tax=Flavobacterium enshiense TaxID=1341165 RepID=UPI00345D293E